MRSVDAVLHLLARYAGSAAAREVAHMFALQWHHEGLTPYIVFDGRSDHGDADIESAQRWLSKHFSVANPVEAMLKRSTLAERTFKRRFVSATGLAPIATWPVSRSWRCGPVAPGSCRATRCP